MDYHKDDYKDSYPKVHPTNNMPITSSHQSPMSSTSSVSQHRDYDYLRSQFENAMEQLQVLKQVVHLQQVFVDYHTINLWNL